MKTFETLSIDELIDYCINFRKSNEASNKFLEIKSLVENKIELIDNKDEKEYYKTIIEDILDEIENNIECGDYDLIKDKMIEEYVSNFNAIDEKINQQLAIEEKFSDELQHINLYYTRGYKHYIMSAKDSLYLDNEYSRFFSNQHRMALLDDSYIGTKLKISSESSEVVNYNFRLSTIGEFQKLDSLSCNRINLQVDYNVDLISYLFLGKIRNIINQLSNRKKLKASQAVTCFTSLDPMHTLGSFTNAMSYFKINRDKSYHKMKHLDRRLDQGKWHKVAINIKKCLSHKALDKQSEVIWFKLDIPNCSKSFDYSNIYKDEVIRSKNITWFKLMSSNHIEHHGSVAYFRIDTDGSITEEEVAYFDKSRESSCNDIDFNLNIDEVKEQPDTLHYIITDEKESVHEKDFPMLIGYSERAYSSYLK